MVENENPTQIRVAHSSRSVSLEMRFEATNRARKNIAVGKIKIFQLEKYYNFVSETSIIISMEITGDFPYLSMTNWQVKSVGIGAQPFRLFPAA